jgi:hypothetical protein
MNVTPVQSGYGMDYLQKGISNTNEVVEEKSTSTVESINEDRKLTNEEARHLYYANKATDLMKSVIEIYQEAQNDEAEDIMDYQDIRDIQKTQNRMDMVQYYQNEARIQNGDTKYEMWA